MDCWSLSLPLDDEFKKLVNRMNPHRVTIDNDSSRKATPIKVASANKRGSLLEVVQAVLVHLDKNMGSPLASESFKKLQCAYEVLSDSVKKRDYDEQLRKEESKTKSVCQRSQSYGTSQQSLVVGSLYCNLPVQGSLALAFLMEQ
ncbi:dnaJ-like protein subfamily C member 14-like isoform X2 [Cucumis melo var. makuwa]|uniref:DnaJ-like protein subfamily C member 14-like isoform X2 n=1 Tax=Cucumis melo var. makuwa TaxID=1194695 RepID=A0A5A7SS18_CUCMM|nr:dnaJ-like protein subfamily C member 14-like isoform X2 [Cucumis melo var. makuwa]